MSSPWRTCCPLPYTGWTLGSTCWSALPVSGWGCSICAGLAHPPICLSCCSLGNLTHPLSFAQRWAFVGDCLWLVHIGLARSSTHLFRMFSQWVLRQLLRKPWLSEPVSWRTSQLWPLASTAAAALPTAGFAHHFWLGPQALRICLSPLNLCKKKSLNSLECY